MRGNSANVDNIRHIQQLFKLDVLIFSRSDGAYWAWISAVSAYQFTSAVFIFPAEKN